MQDVNWTYIRRSGDVWETFRMPYVPSCCVLCPVVYAYHETFGNTSVDDPGNWVKFIWNILETV